MSKPEGNDTEKWFDEARETEMGREVAKIKDIYGPYSSMMDISTEFLNQLKPKVVFSTTNNTSTP